MNLRKTATTLIIFFETIYRRGTVCEQEAVRARQTVVQPAVTESTNTEKWRYLMVYLQSLHAPGVLRMSVYAAGKWDLAKATLFKSETTTEDDREICLGVHPDFQPHAESAVLKTFSQMLRINWRRNDEPKGPAGDLSYK